VNKLRSLNDVMARSCRSMAERTRIDSGTSINRSQTRRAVTITSEDPSAGGGVRAGAWAAAHATTVNGANSGQRIANLSLEKLSGQIVAARHKLSSPGTVKPNLLVDATRASRCIGAPAGGAQRESGLDKR